MTHPQRISQVRPVRRPPGARVRAEFVAALLLVSLGAAGWWARQTVVQLRELHSAGRGSVVVRLTL